MALDDVADVLAHQDGVVSRTQLLGAGLTRARIETLLRRRDLVPVHPGVYLTHTGTPTWSQRAWAATLYAGRSALHLGSALHEPHLRRPAPDGPIHVAVDWTRRVRPQPGIRVHRVTDLERQVRWNLSPPRVHLEVAAVECAHQAPTDLEAISVLADSVGTRRTTAARLRHVLDTRSRTRRRSLIRALLDDLDAGTHSVLEHGFLDRVIRPHGLPLPSARQAPRNGRRGREYRDVHYDDLGLPLELDGVLHDTSIGRDDDADRDLDDLASGWVVPRLRYRQVFTTPCRTAARLDALFRLRGWTGTARSCGGPGCPIGEPGTSS